MLAQTKPIPSSSLLLMHTLALITSSNAYLAEAVQEAEWIQEVRARDEQVIYFTLRQLDEEAVQAKTEAVVQDVISTLNLHTVFPRMKRANRRMHQAALELLLEEAAESLISHLYGKDDVLPLNCWMPRDMDVSAKAVYTQTVEMTEPQLCNLRTWIY